MKFGKQKFDFKAKNYLKTYYIKNGKAVISINIDDPEMFYERLDADRITLSRDITDFIDKRIDYIPYRYSIVIKFYCKSISREEEKKIVNMLRAHYGLETNELANEMKLNNLKSLSLFIMGLCLLGMSSVANVFGYLVKEVLSIAGWVAIWETVTSVLFGAVRLKLDRYDSNNIYNAEIIFIEEKNN